jgi:hypothetical protein
MVGSNPAFLGLVNSGKPNDFKMLELAKAIIE